MKTGPVFTDVGLPPKSPYSIYRPLLFRVRTSTPPSTGTPPRLQLDAYSAEIDYTGAQLSARHRHGKNT